MSTFIEKIVFEKKKLVERKKAKLPLSSLRDMLKETSSTRGFKEAISRPDRVNIIGEIKQASPSAGIIRNDFNVTQIATELVGGGVSAISVLTEEKYFSGDLFHLLHLYETVNVPLLRKDFIFDEYQIYESRVYKADAVLFIAEILQESQLRDYVLLCRELNLDALVELHTESELEKVLKTETEIIGINNRNLSDFTVDMNTTFRLKPRIPNDKVIVAESGIKNKTDILKLKEIGVNAVLIGETLMRSADIKKTLKELINDK